MQRTGSLSRFARRHKIALIGLEDNLGNNYWNASKACCDFNLSQVDDIAFLNSLIDEASKVAILYEGGALFGNSYTSAAFRKARIRLS